MTNMNLIGDGDAFEVDGYTFRCSIEHDADMGEPWKEHDGHGIVSNWTTRDKRPGERILSQDHGSYRYYDFAETLKIALKDWVEDGKRNGKTKRQRAVEAVEQDFERLKAWCNDQWSWIGVVVTLLDVDGEPVRKPGLGASLWGIESDSPEYHDHVARELAAEIIGLLDGADAISLKLREVTK